MIRQDQARRFAVATLPAAILAALVGFGISHASLSPAAMYLILALMGASVVFQTLVPGSGLATPLSRPGSRPSDPRATYDDVEASQYDEQLETPTGITTAYLVIPTTFEHAKGLADAYRASKLVIMNLENTEKELSKRMIDFSSGLVYAAGGSFQRIGTKIFLLVPGAVTMSAHESATQSDEEPDLAAVVWMASRRAAS